MKEKDIVHERLIYNQLRYNQHIRKTVVVDTITGWLFVSPLLVVAVLFVTSAIIIALVLSLFQGGLNNLQYVGILNWRRIFTVDLGLDIAFQNTFWFAIVSVPITILVSLSIAAILHSPLIKRRNLFLSIFFLPQITSSIASTIIFRQLISPDGLIQIDYFANPRLILWVVVISSIWGGVAGSLITFNTAFVTIDKTQYEAAALDGANGMKKFTKITMPSIAPIVSYSLLLGIIGGLGIFDGPYLLARQTNLPANSLMTLILRGFFFIIPPNTSTIQNFGLGTAILFMVAIVIAGFTFIANVVTSFSKDVH